MDAEFWLKRWREGATGFHMDRVSPLLMKYWASLGLPQASRVLVPLCGKSLDMVWLASQGHRVLGVELAPMAVEQFFHEQNLTPVESESALGKHYIAGEIEIICGDIFQLDSATLAGCTGVYDRGALVALPPEMRSRYVEHVYGGLAAGYRGMLLTLEYDIALMDGPPFSIPSNEVGALFSGHTQPRELNRMDIIEHELKFAERGLDTLNSVVWRLDGIR